MLTSYTGNQVTPFGIATSDNETLYAWHVLPLGLYAKHENELLNQSPGFAEDVTNTTAFQLLRNDPESKLVISCTYTTYERDFC